MPERNHSIRPPGMCAAVVLVLVCFASCHAEATNAKSAAYIVQDDGTISAYSMSAAGTFHPLATPVTKVGEHPTALVAAPTGNYAYIADGTSRLRTFRIADDGALSCVDTITLTSRKLPSCIVIDPAAKHVYVSLGAPEEDGGSELYQFAVGSDGRLSSLSPPSLRVGSATNRLAVHPSGAYLYAGNSWAGTISQYRVSREGTLSPLDPEVIRGCGLTGDLEPGHSGEFVYATERRTETLQQYAVGSDGHLSPAATSPFHSDIGGRGSGAAIDIDLSGNFLTVAYPAGSAVVRFALADGKLLPVCSYNVTRNNTLVTTKDLFEAADRTPAVQAALSGKNTDQLKIANARGRSRHLLVSGIHALTHTSDGTLYLLTTSGVLHLMPTADGKLQSLGSALQWPDKMDAIDANVLAHKNDIYEGVVFPVGHGLTIVAR